MPTSINTKVAELLMESDIDLMRFEAGARGKVVAMLRDLYPKLTGHIAGIDPTSPKRLVTRNKRLKLLVDAAGKDITKTYREVASLMGVEERAVAGAQASEIAAAANAALTVELVSGRLNAEVLKSLSLTALIEGAPSRDWWKKQDRGLRENFEREMREAVVNGETIDDMVRRVRGRATGKRNAYWVDGVKKTYVQFRGGLMDTATRKAEALVRSSVLAVANEARYATYQANDDVIKGSQWLSTLDLRTTTICRALDGQSWYLDGRRMPGTELSWRGPPPAHWQCRSTLVPVLKPWSSMVQDKGIAKKLRKAEAKAPPGLRASMDGQVSDRLNYEEWLRGQSKARQLEVLGPTKHRLWKDGKLPFTQLIDQSHNPLTIEELKQKFS